MRDLFSPLLKISLVYTFPLTSSRQGSYLFAIIALERRLNSSRSFDDPAPEERAAALQRGLVDDQRRALGLYPLHHALDAALAEVVTAGLHRQAVHADDGLVLPRGVPLPVVLVRSGHFRTCPAMKSFLVRLLSTIAVIMF